MAHIKAQSYPRVCHTFFIMAVEATSSPDPIQSFEPLSISPWKYQKQTPVEFDSSKHHHIERPAWKKQLEDLGYNNDTGISEIGVTAPFQMFSDEAIRLMRRDILSKPVQENCIFASPRSPYMIRGYAPRYSKFIYDAWMHPKTLEAISRAANLDLVPVFDYEIGHVNIQLGDKGLNGISDLSEFPEPPLPPVEKSAEEEKCEKPVFKWHYDDEPFVAVLMLSDMDTAKGGETAVRCGDGSVQVVPGPNLGKIVVMQGSALFHVALRAHNSRERITMVTSFRPRNPMIKDMTRMTLTHESSDMAIMGKQWLQYRLETLAKRCALMSDKFSKTFSEEEVKNFCSDEIQWLEATYYEVFRNSL